jgi:hypothetical protein
LQKGSSPAGTTFSLYAYAWALHVNGREAEARKHIGAAVAVGIRDVKMFRHAGEIALSAGDHMAAKRYYMSLPS